MAWKQNVSLVYVLIKEVLKKLFGSGISIEFFGTAADVLIYGQGLLN